MPELPPELQARLDAISAEAEAMLARMLPLDLDAELRRIDVQLAKRHGLTLPLDVAAIVASLDRQADELRRQVEREPTWWDRWMPAFVVIGGMTAGAALFAAGMFVASRMPAGHHDDGVLALVCLSLFLVSLAVLSSRR